MPFIQAAQLLGSELIDLLLLDSPDGPSVMTIKRSYTELFLYENGQIIRYQVYDWYHYENGLASFYRVGAQYFTNLEQYNVLDLIRKHHVIPYRTHQDLHHE